MNAKQQKKISKFLSLVLRHKPQTIGIELDDSGWTDVETLIEKMNGAGPDCSLAQLKDVVASNDKQRFQFNDDGSKIRATQGHSVNVELGYEAIEPPEVLLHGTPTKFLASIREQGLSKQSRHHVHLHDDDRVAEDVGNRRGTAVILKIDAKSMYLADYKFFVSPNGVWLTDHVPPEFIEFPDEE